MSRGVVGVDEPLGGGDRGKAFVQWIWDGQGHSGRDELKEVGDHFELVDVDIELVVDEACTANNVGRPCECAPETVGVGDKAAPTGGGGVTVAGAGWVSRDKMADGDRPRVGGDR
jgi:hypothetical protein